MANTEYIDRLTEQLEHVEICEHLQEIAGQATEYIQGLIDSIERELEAIFEQMVVPFDLATCIIWIKNQIEPKYAAFMKLLDELQSILSAAEGLMSAINKAIGNVLNCQVGVNLTIPVPQLNIGTIESINRGFNPFPQIEQNFNRIRNLIPGIQN